MWMPVFPAIFERFAGILLSVDGSATQLPAILLARLLDLDAPLGFQDISFRNLVKITSPCDVTIGIS